MRRGPFPDPRPQVFRGGEGKSHEGSKLQDGERGGKKPGKLMCPGGFSRREWGPLPGPSPQEFRKIWGGGINNTQANTNGHALYKLKIETALTPEASAAAPSTRARTKAGRSGPTSSRVSQARVA
jgi:hypothetical protein